MTRFAALACAVLFGCSFGGSFGKPKAKAPRDERRAPATVARAIELRIYVERALSRRPGWQARARALVEQANSALERDLQMRLIVEVVRSWDRKASGDAALLAELEALDAGSETTWVLGLIERRGPSPTALHDHGAARLDGRHLLVRRGNESALADKISLLHQIGHVLGEDHGAAESDFMFPTLRGSQREFDRDSAARMRSNLHKRFTEPAKREQARARERRAAEREAKLAAFSKRIAAATSITDRPGALAQLAAITTDLERAKIAHDPFWIEIARGYMKHNALTLAEQAIARSRAPTELHEVHRWTISTRARAAVAPTGAARIPTPREPEYIELVQGSITAITESQNARAHRLLGALSKQFPRSAGLAVARCYRALYAGRLGLARRHCRRAVGLYPGASWGHFLLGFVERRRRRPASAVPHFEKSLEVDPYLEPAWRALAEIYTASKNTAALEALRTRYEKIFNSPM